MIQAIEVQVISKILTCDDDPAVIDALMAFPPDLYFSAYINEIQFIHDQKDSYNIIPSVFNFQAQFPDFNIVRVPEPIEYLVAQLRKYRRHLLLIETFNKIKDLGDGDTDLAWQYLSSRCDQANMLEEHKPMDLIKDVDERAKQIEEYAKQKRIPTGFAEIDKLMYGGLSTVEELLVIIARTNSGKAQPLWAPVLTPAGWTTMGELKVGDEVVGMNNDNGKIVKLFPQGKKEYYRITFSDGTYAECCDDHLWTVLDNKRRERSNRNYGQYLVLTTKEIRSSLNKRYSVDMTEPVEFVSDFDETRELDGYLLGLLIGDGSLRDGRPMLTNESEEIWSRVESIIEKYNCIRSPKSPFSIISLDNNCNIIKRKLEEYGLMNTKSIHKFIPKQYLTAPVHVRKALLAGLVDTDGYAPKNSAMLWEFDTASEQLAIDFVELARSLGICVKVHPRKESFYTSLDGTRHQGSGSIHIVCRSAFNPFWLSDKANRYNNDMSPRNGAAPKRLCKMIESVELIGETECQCILLDNDSHTYITSDYTVTHNTWVCTKMMESAQKHNFPVAYYSPEMQAAYLGTRFDTWRGHFENNKLFRGDYSQEYYAYMKSLKNEDTSAFVIEDKDFPDGVSVQTLEPFIKKNGIKLLVIDGISYMNDDYRATRDQEKYKNIALGLFKLSKKYGCAVVLVMQANREVKSKDDKGESVPTLYNAEGSDQPCRIATQAFGIRQIFDKHVLDIGLLKSRMADNRTPVFSYAWDINTGQAQYIPGDDSTASDFSSPATPTVPTQGTTPTISFGTAQPDTSDLSLLDDADDSDIEF